jgi:hypothetical protein
MLQEISKISQEEKRKNELILYQFQLSFLSGSFSSLEDILDDTGIYFRRMNKSRAIAYLFGLLHNDDNRKKFAKNLFNSLKRSHDNITIKEFQPYFSSDEETCKAFKLFDADNDAEISKKEFYGKLSVIEEEKVNLEESLRNSGQAMRKLDNLLCVFVLIICIFTTLSLL